MPCPFGRMWARRSCPAATCVKKRDRSGCWGAGFSDAAVEVLRDQVGPDGMAEQIEELSIGADAAGALEVAVVVDGAVDRFLFPPTVDAVVGRVAGGDLAHVCAVEASGSIVVVRVGAQAGMSFGVPP